MTNYEDWGVPLALNGVGPATRMGGVPMAREVWQAMERALDHPVRMDALQAGAGAHLARLLGVPAVYVTSGASAALVLATAAAMTRGRAELIDQLPHAAGMRHRVVIQSAQRDPYDRAAEAAGATLVPVGYPESTHPGELERAIDDDTAAVLYRPGRAGNLLPLEATARIAHAAGVPVIVDGALFAPPVQRLRAFFEAGADLVCVSGGKGFRGPQGSGLLCGSPELIGFIAAQHQDMDERDTTWPVAAGTGTGITPPRHGIGRAMKVGREQLVGLVVAIERYLRDPGADERPGIEELDDLESTLLAGGAIAVRREFDRALNVPYLELDTGKSGLAIDAVIHALAERAVPVYLGEAEAWRGVLTVNPMALGSGHGRQIAEAVIEVVEALGADPDSAQAASEHWRP